MGIRGLAARFGAGGAKVDTVLEPAVTTPGGALTGTVHLAGGSVAQEVREVRLSFEATVEVESGDQEWREDVRFATQALPAGFALQAGEQRALPFRFAVPWQTPFTTLGGWHLRGVRLGVVTKVDIAGAVDPGDLDAVTVQPLPVQTAVLDALGGLGFTFRRADVERGRLPGSELPFYQEVELAPPAGLRRHMNELEVTFLADPAGTDVVLEADRRGGLFTEGRDAVSRLRLSHGDTDARRLAGALDAEVRRLGQRRGWF